MTVGGQARAGGDLRRSRPLVCCRFAAAGGKGAVGGSAGSSRNHMVTTTWPESHGQRRVEIVSVELMHDVLPNDRSLPSPAVPYSTSCDI